MPDIQFFNIDAIANLIAQHNVHGAELVRGSVYNKTPSDEPFIGHEEYIFSPTQTFKEPFSLQRPDPNIFYSLFRAAEMCTIEETLQNAGYVFVQVGSAVPMDARKDTRRYESLVFRIKVPLLLKNGSIVPPSSIKLTVIEGETEIQRRDHRKINLLPRIGYFPISKRRDYSKELPTDLFLQK